jgi:hypothetical protein
MCIEIMDVLPEVLAMPSYTMDLLPLEAWLKAPPIYMSP